MKISVVKKCLPTHFNFFSPENVQHFRKLNGSQVVELTTWILQKAKTAQASHTESHRFPPFINSIQHRN